MKQYTFLQESKRLKEDPEIINLMKLCSDKLREYGDDDDYSSLIHVLIDKLKTKVSKKNKDAMDKYIRHLWNLLSFDCWGGYISNDIWMNKIFSIGYFNYINDNNKL